MGEVANEVLAGGGRVIGVIPELLLKKEHAHRGLTELHLVQTMHERKAMMIDKADGFIAPPGGAGTLEEFFEVWTWAQLNMHEKPCGLLNVAGYYDAMLRFLDHAVAESFIRPSTATCWWSSRTPSRCWTATPPTGRRLSRSGSNRSRPPEAAGPGGPAITDMETHAMTHAPQPQPSTESVLRDYFHAKDENRPLYMARAFAPDAVLKMALRTQAIAFPPESHGLAAITDTLVRKFGQTYDNVFTFYLSRPEAGQRLSEYRCDWLVGMTERPAAPCASAVAATTGTSRPSPIAPSA